MSRISVVSDLLILSVFFSHAHRNILLRTIAIQSNWNDLGKSFCTITAHSAKTVNSQSISEANIPASYTDSDFLTFCKISYGSAFITQCLSLIYS